MEVKWLAKPLISINRITEKIANLDFTEKLPVRSADEIGQLIQDLDKERKLETIRKEFIAGVSHELKTPLAVMKSCLSILKDGIAAEKREHFFQAMDRQQKSALKIRGARYQRKTGKRYGTNSTVWRPGHQKRVRVLGLPYPGKY